MASTPVVFNRACARTVVCRDGQHQHGRHDIQRTPANAVDLLCDDIKDHNLLSANGAVVLNALGAILARVDDTERVAITIRLVRRHFWSNYSGVCVQT